MSKYSSDNYSGGRRDSASCRLLGKLAIPELSYELAPLLIDAGWGSSGSPLLWIGGYSYPTSLTLFMLAIMYDSYGPPSFYYC